MVKKGTLAARLFDQTFAEHSDGWETHYSWADPFEVREGWRVSYPHKSKRGDVRDKESIWVEKHVEGWPKEWFDTGYVVIK